MKIALHSVTGVTVSVTLAAAAATEGFFLGCRRSTAPPLKGSLSSAVLFGLRSGEASTHFMSPLDDVRGKLLPSSHHISQSFKANSCILRFV